LDNLLEAVNIAVLDNNSGSGGISRRQLFDDIKFMESENGWSIPLDRLRDGRKKTYRYSDLKFSINNQPINEMETEQIKSALLVLSRFKGMPQFGWVEEMIPKLEQAFGFVGTEKEIISFDANQFLQGIEYLGTLFNAILYKKTLEIEYQSFKSDKPDISVIHPYYLKQYNNRWFLIGKTDRFDTISIRSLDRIKNIKEVEQNYIENTIFDFDEYFEDIIGITKPKDGEAEIIELLFSPKQAPYILTKPIHGSQIKKKFDEHGLIITIEVIPNFELEKLILSFGKDIEVLSPESFRKQIADKLMLAANKY